MFKSHYIITMLDYYVLWKVKRSNVYLHHIPAEPYSREVTPSQLFDHLVAVSENVSYLYAVVTTCNTTSHLHQRKHLNQCVAVWCRGAAYLCHNLQGSPAAHRTIPEARDEDVSVQLGGSGLLCWTRGEVYDSALCLGRGEGWV